MFSIQVGSIGSQLKGLMSSLVKQIASTIETPGGQGTLPTKSQLTKMGPQSEFTRRSPDRNGW